MGLDVVNTTKGSESSNVIVSVSKTDITPYCVPTARYLPDFENDAAKLPRRLVWSDWL
jgi:hypothetical protein